MTFTSNDAEHMVSYLSFVHCFVVFALEKCLFSKHTFLTIIALWQHHFIHQMIFVPLRIGMFRGYLCYYTTDAFVY